MHYQVVQPCGELAEYIDYFWILEGRASEAEPFSIRTTANAFAELIFHYHGAFYEIDSRSDKHRSFVSGIHGQSTQFRDFLVTDNFGMLGVRLFPYALNSFFNIPALELSNELPDLSSILARPQRDMYDCVLHASDNEERIRLITAYLLPNLQNLPRPGIVSATRKIISANGCANINALMGDHCLSTRQFERLFKQQIGFSPKKFSRIVRFNALMKFASQNNKRLSLTQLAYEHGYYDQAHFIGEFKEFAGMSPHRFFSERRLYV